jgi:hypothetical protein
MSNSPSPPPAVAIPSFLPSRSGATEGEEAGEEDRRARFRRVYMEKMVEGFGSDLDKLRTVRPPVPPIA